MPEAHVVFCHPVWLLQERKVLRVVCRWDLGAELVQELLDDIKVWHGLPHVLRGTSSTSTKKSIITCHHRKWVMAIETSRPHLTLITTMW